MGHHFHDTGIRMIHLKPHLAGGHESPHIQQALMQRPFQIQAGANPEGGFLEKIFFIHRGPDFGIGFS